MMRPACLALCLAILAVPVSAQADGTSALTAVRSLPDVLEAHLDDRGTIWAVVQNTRASWTQYAQALCLLVRPHQARIFSARVVDVTSVGRGRKSNEWKVLAQAKCGDV